MRNATHKEIVKFHKDIARFHVDIKGFYRFNISEIAGGFRGGVDAPALLLESHSSELETSPNRTTTFNGKAISFLLIDYTGKPDNYDKQEEVLDRMENIALDICAYLVEKNKDQESFLYGLFDASSFKMEKVGPIFDSMYGWNVLYTLKNKESMILDTEKWDFNAPEVP